MFGVMRVVLECNITMCVSRVGKDPQGTHQPSGARVGVIPGYMKEALRVNSYKYSNDSRNRRIVVMVGES